MKFSHLIIIILSFIFSNCAKDDDSKKTSTTVTSTNCSNISTTDGDVFCYKFGNEKFKLYTDVPIIKQGETVVEEYEVLVAKRHSLEHLMMQLTSCNKIMQRLEPITVHL